MAVVTGKRSERFAPRVRRLLGGLLPLVDDEGVRDVLLVPAEPRGTVALWVDRGSGCEAVRGWSASAEVVRQLAVGLVQAGGGHVDELHPVADAELGGGVRVHAVVPPASRGGPVVSLRLPAVARPSLAELVRGGLCGEATGRWLRQQVLERRNLLVSGGTGSGKTTLLGALLGEVPGSERIVTIEDVPELRPRHPHVVQLVARQASIEGVGELSLTELLRASLRMRPDRVVLGECRGAEIATLLSALNTGHAGSAGTVHANSISAVPARLEALGALAGLSARALALQAVAGVEVIVHVARTPRGHRLAGVGRLAFAGGALVAESLAPEQCRA